jgi:hypothetical protein
MGLPPMGSNPSHQMAFESSNISPQEAFRFPNMSQFRKFCGSIRSTNPTWCVRAFLADPVRTAWRRPWPLVARIPIVSGPLILFVAITISHFMMSAVIHEQELGVRRLAAVCLDGISTMIYPHVVARNLTNTAEALRRTMWFHQSMHEQRAMVNLPDGALFADVSAPNSHTGDEDPFHDVGLRQQLERWQGFVFDPDTGTGWASRAIVRDGNHVADLYVALDLN